MLEYLIYAAKSGVIDAILLLADLYYHGSVGNNFDIDINKSVVWYYEGFIVYESSECLLYLLRLLLKLLREEQSKRIQTQDTEPTEEQFGSYLHFQTIQDDGTVVTVQDMFQSMHDSMITPKWKKLVSDADYQILYSLIVQIAKLLS